MRAGAALAVVLGAVSALAGLAVAAAAFEPIPYADSIDFFHRFFAVGGWEGYGLAELYARHNEHRLVVPRLWFLLDIALFDATQAFLIIVTILSAVLHATVLAWVFRSLGHRGPLLWAFAAVALGAALSPAQWENLVWSFQVQFVQVWLFATLAFAAVASAAGRGSAVLIAAAVVCGLTATYSMANGLLVWPLLLVLALWRGLRGSPVWLLLAAAATVVGVEAANYHAHAGHGDPLQTIGQPVDLLRYASRYLTSGVAAIGGTGQELLGGALVAAWAAMALHALLRRDRVAPGHGVLIAVAGFVIGAAVLTALGRVTFGIDQANAARYATPSLVFMMAVLGLVLDRLSRVGQRYVTAGLTAGVALLLVPGLVDGGRNLQAIVDQGNARADAVIAFAAGAARPDAMKVLYPLAPGTLARVLKELDRRGWGPFAERSDVTPPPSIRMVRLPRTDRICEGGLGAVTPNPAGISLSGWFSAPFGHRPEWVVAVDDSSRVVAWGAGRFAWRRLGKSINRGSARWTFDAVGPDARSRVAAVIVIFRGGEACSIEAADPSNASRPAPPTFAGAP